jgi:hypothetical protein
MSARSFVSFTFRAILIIRSNSSITTRIPDKTRPLNIAERALWRKARAKGGLTVARSRERINVTLEKELLKQADKVAREKGLRRSELIAQALTAMITRKAS